MKDIRVGDMIKLVKPGAFVWTSTDPHDSRSLWLTPQNDCLLVLSRCRTIDGDDYVRVASRLGVGYLSSTKFEKYAEVIVIELGGR